MREPRLIRVAGDRRWAELAHKDLRDIEVDFEMVSYNPIRKNPSVMIESLLQIVPFLAENPNVDMRKLTEEIISGMGLSRRVIIPQAELEAMEQEQMAAMQAEAAASLGGAAGGEAYIEQQKLAQLQQLLTQLPPEEAQQLAAELSEQTGIEIPVAGPEGQA